jgi:putative FmdB family regulatory protein
LIQSRIRFLAFHLCDLCDELQNSISALLSGGEIGGAGFINAASSWMEELMPIYEYFCGDCRKRVSVFFRTFSEASDDAARCPTCQGARLRRLVSRVAVLKSEDRRMEDMADSSLMSGLESEDPRALAGFMRRMSDEMGEPLDPEMNEVIGRLEAGENPDEIEKSMPDLAGDMGGGMMDSGPLSADDDF